MRLAAAVSVAVLALVVPASAGAEPDAYVLIQSDSNPVGALERFDTANPSSATLASAVAITGTSGARVLGIDYRPANRVLYGIAENSKLYSINPDTGAATQVGGPGSTTLDPFTGPPGPLTPFQGLGIDFDPLNDILRVTEDDGAVNGQDDNFSVDPNTGVFTQQGDLGGPATDIDVSGVAYTNSLAGAAQTTLYGIETNQPVSGNTRLVVIDPPAAGTVTTVDNNGNGVGFALGGTNQSYGLDIISDPTRAFAAVHPSTTSVYDLYRVDLRAEDGGTGTGDATSVGVIDSSFAQGAIPGFAVRGLALVPPAPPEPPTTPVTPPDTSPPNVALADAPSSLALSKFLKGFKASATPSEPAALDFVLEGAAKSATLAATYNLSLATRSLPLAAGKRSVKLKPGKKLIGKPRKSFKVRLRVVATDALKNSRTVTKTIKVTVKKKKRR